MAISTIARFREPHEAHIFRALLEANDIPAFVVDEHYVGLNWLASLAVGGVKLQVPEEDVDAAIELLQAPANAVPEIPDGEVCPACGASDSVATTLDRRVRATSMWLGFPLGIGQYRFRCVGCGHHWRSVPAHRGVAYRLADLLVLLWISLSLVWRLPIAAVRFIRDFVDPRTLQCWSCLEAFPVGSPTCPSCGISLPPARSFERVIEAGKAYDATCPHCHTPYASDDYEGDQRACSYCHLDLTHGGE